MPTFITLIAIAFIVTPTIPGTLTSSRKGRAQDLGLNSLDTPIAFPVYSRYPKASSYQKNLPDNKNWVLPLIIGRRDFLNPDENKNAIPMNRVPQSPGFKLCKEYRFYEYEL